MGGTIERMLRISVKNEENDVERDNRQACLLGTTDGMLAVVCPISESRCKRLLSLQHKLVTTTTHYAGLNPRPFRYLFFFLKLDRQFSMYAPHFPHVSVKNRDRESHFFFLYVRVRFNKNSCSVDD